MKEAVLKGSLFFFQQSFLQTINFEQLFNYTIEQLKNKLLADENHFGNRDSDFVCSTG